jgi:3'-phosphoadenosine 5'-phosphosulfate sulfotransferase (PAPS reductase)/FAD synthetase
MELPDLRSFDWILLNTSSGKDSQTMMRYVTRACREANVDPGRIVAAHADLGEMEWPGCPELAAKQSELNGIWRFEITKRTGCDLLEYARRRGKWPSPQQRWCTSDFKRGPIRRVMTTLATEMREWEEQAYRRMSRPVRILNCMGMRAQESPARAKKQPYEFDKSASNGRREVWNWLPIHQWPVEEVWSDIRASGVPHHEAYDFGMPRLSCCFCIFAPKAALILAGKHRPDLLAKYVEVEREIKHTFKKDLSLVQIQEAVLAGESVEVADWKM